MKEIPVRDKTGIIAHALVDDDQFELVSKYKWYLDGKGYVYAYLPRTRTKSKLQNIRLHRLVMNAPKGVDVDHKNHNLLDNRKSQLRLATKHQNQANRIKMNFFNGKPTTSIYKGVHWRKQQKQWAAEIMINYRKIYLGLFKSEAEAGKAYNEAAKKHFGEYALLNKIPEPCEPITDWFSE